ncbi:unnamed protein product [Penicillium glandicola]
MSLVSNRVVVANMKPFYIWIWKCSHPNCIAHPRSKRAIFCRVVQRPLWALICIIGIINLLAAAWQCLAYLFRQDLTSGIFPSERSSSFSDWYTRGVIPLPCHSHNDYWHHVPLRSALRAGCISVEVEVWPWENEILVGPSRYKVLRGTLQGLYLDTLLKMLDTHNAPPSHDRSKFMNQETVGLFSYDPKQTLTLLINFKTGGDRIWPLLVEQLNPFREKGYLTHFNGSDVIHGPIIVVANGDAPLHLMLQNTTYRDVFYDVPLGNLTFPTEITADDNEPLDSTYNPSNSYYASADFQEAIGPLYLSHLLDAQLATLRSQVRAAHDLGLKVRYWGTPTWPVGLRNEIWNALVREGVDVINMDVSRGVTKQDWKIHYWWKW